MGTERRDSSLPEMHGTVLVPSGGRWLRRLLAFSGPAYLVSVGYMDPGNWATDLAGGARFGYQLIWVLLASNLMAVLLQTLSARLGVVTGKDLAQECRDSYPRAVAIPLWIGAEVAIVACDLAEVLGLDWAEVHADAEVLEHHVSDRVLEALDRVVGHPAEDPHGSPIPDSKGHLTRRVLAPLAALPPGARARVREVHESDGRRLARWKELGLVPGARVRVREVREADGVIELEVGGRRVVTASAALDGVLVEAAPGGTHGA